MEGSPPESRSRFRSSDELSPIACLKRATHASHEAVERTAGLELLFSPGLTLESYREILSRFLRLHSEWEQFIDERLLRTAPFDSVSHRRSPALHSDLMSLGWTRDRTGSTEEFTNLLTSPHAATGALYVIEGSMLGGAMIARQITRHHGGRLPTAFFESSGMNVGQEWKKTVAEIDRALVNSEALEEAVEGAKLTFAAFARVFSLPLLHNRSGSE